MKKSNLKFLTLGLLILLAQNTLAVNYQAGPGSTATGTDSVAVGVDNIASGKWSSAFGVLTYTSGEGSGTFGVGGKDGSGNYLYKNEGNYSFSIGRNNNIAAGTENNHILGNDVSIAAGINNVVVLGAGSEVSEDFTVSVGSAANKRRIVNVGDGVNASDAATFGQVEERAKKDASNLSAADVNAWKTKLGVDSVGIENLRNEVNKKLNDTRDEMRGIGSLSAALSALHPMQYDPQAPNQIMAGVGTYRNKQAIAVGMTHYFKENVMMTAGVALSNERKTNAMANVGLTWKIGKGGSASATNAPSYVMQDELRRLTLENNKQNQENQELKARVKVLEEKLEMLLKSK